MNLLWNQEKDYNHLASVNSKAISEYNEKILSALALMGGLLMMLPILAAPFSSTKGDAVPSYLLACGLFFTLFFVFRLSSGKNAFLAGCISVFLSCSH